MGCLLRLLLQSIRRFTHHSTAFAFFPHLLQCFHCGFNQGLLKTLFDYDIKVCYECHDYVACRRLKLEQVVDIFGFSKAEAKDIPGILTNPICGHDWGLDEVIDAVIQRDGSFFHFIEKKFGRVPTPTTGALLQAAATMSDKMYVIRNALWASSEASLKSLVEEVAKAVPNPKTREKFLDTFAPAAAN